jgi:hypothetical protein
MIRQPLRHRAIFRRHPLRNISVPHRRIAEDLVERLRAVHLVYIGEEDVVAEVAPDGWVVHCGTDGEPVQVRSVPDSRVEEEGRGPNGAGGEDNFFEGEDMFEWGCMWPGGV